MLTRAFAARHLAPPPSQHETGSYRALAIGAPLDAHLDERARLDLAYIDEWSLGLDLKILRLTVPAVLGRTGQVAG